MELPQELELLAPSLRRLDLSACGLRALPAQISALTGVHPSCSECGCGDRRPRGRPGLHGRCRCHVGDHWLAQQHGWWLLRELSSPSSNPAGLTRLDLSRNSAISRLPEGALDPLSALVELDLFGTPIASPGPALQRCSTLRRLVVGGKGSSSSSGAALPLASRLGLGPGTPANAHRQRRALARSSGGSDGSDGGASASGSSSSLASADGGSADGGGEGGGSTASSSLAASPARSWEEELSLQLPWVREVIVGSA